MNTTIRSRDGATFHFTAPVDGGYVWVSINDGNRKQICRGGYTMGETLTAYSAAGLKKTARRWYRAHRRLTH
ncbi:hypothetical protein UFOVP452_7 [uncultured Caudovirales phage]|uniref:Uncharacterized protein n=1 Tax=uncultured Caudovirales phage TaxID=2100421 RepID=A0A6J5MB72_9CAUD|nr:hypothetical protein UFOVP452_7 [uncultured Caudovirales phage]